MILMDLEIALDPLAFAASVGIEPDPWQVHALEFSGKRLILNCSRQSGKSTIAAVKGLHRTLYFPGSLILLVSASFRQSQELFKIVFKLLERLEDAPRKVEDNKLSLTFENGSRIVSIPSSQATVRGYSGVSLALLDEAAQIPDDLFRTIRPMLAVSDGSMILMSTPFGKRGFFYEEWTAGDWEKIEVPATECPRISAEFLERERRLLGEWWYLQEYGCAFQENIDAVFSHEFILKAFTDEVKPLFEGA